MPVTFGTRSIVSGPGILWQRSAESSTQSTVDSRCAEFSQEKTCPKFVHDVAQGRHNVKQGAFVGTFQLQMLLHQGPRSEVWQGVERQSQSEVAVKVLPIYTAKDRQAALQEAHIMQLLTNPGKTSHSAHLLGSFSATDPKGCECQCLVMDRLYQSAGWVLHYLHQRGRRGLPEPAVKNLTRQLLLFLDDLHRRHKVVHRDIKPSNVLLHHPFIMGTCKGCKRIMTLDEISHAKWRIVDFGNACPLERIGPFWATKWQVAAPAPYDTPAYTPPEAILHVPSTTAHDIWSLGCLVYEAATGYRLFPVDDNPPDEQQADEEHLWMIQQIAGHPSLKVLDRSPVAAQFYDKRGFLHSQQHHSLHHRHLQRLLTDHSGLPTHQVKELSSFLQAMLQFDRDKRPTAQQLLKHPWLSTQPLNVDHSAI
eukprot:jgi/Chrzof1/4123/Cz14g00010.t1